MQHWDVRDANTFMPTHLYVSSLYTGSGLVYTARRSLHLLCLSFVFALGIGSARGRMVNGSHVRSGAVTVLGALRQAA